MTGDARRVVLLEYISMSGRLAVFGVRADWDRPKVELLDLDQEELSLFVAANLDSHAASATSPRCQSCCISTTLLCVRWLSGASRAMSSASSLMAPCTACPCMPCA